MNPVFKGYVDFRGLDNLENIKKLIEETFPTVVVIYIYEVRGKFFVRVATFAGSIPSGIIDNSKLDEFRAFLASKKYKLARIEYFHELEPVTYEWWTR